MTFAVDGIGVCPEILPHGNYKLLAVEISQSRPISKACQRVASVFDSTFPTRSSEREQRILAATRSARWALLDREKEGSNMSRRVDTD